MSWSLVNLEDVVHIEMGQAPTGNTYNTDNVGLPLIAGAGDFGEVTPSPTRYTSNPSKSSKAGDIIVCIRATIGDLNLSDREYCLGRGVAGLRPKAGKIDQRYLWRVMEASAQKLKSKGRGATFLQVSKSDIASIEIPLPPLAEQKRIAAILDQADALRRLRVRTLDRLNILGQAIFHEMFGGASDGDVKKLSEIAELINGDRSSNYPSGDDIKSEGIPFLSTKNIQAGQLVMDNCQYISPEKFSTLSRGKLKRNDIVITLRGTLGQVAKFDCEFDTGFINAQMMIIRASEGVSPQYLLDYIGLDSTQHELMRGQSGSAVKQLTSAQVGELKVTVPTATQQAIYANRISELRSLIRKAQIVTESSDALFTSLQHRAFNGEL